MYNLAIYTFIAIATSISFLFLSSPPKSYYHSLFISDSLSDNSSIANNLYSLTKRPHVAGSKANAEAATYVLSILSSCNIKSHVTSYDVALTYPVSRSLILTPSSSEKPIKFGLIQEIYENDPYADVANEVLPTFHAYARSGTATGPVVYANYGRVEDYATLFEMGVNVSNTVVLARYGKIYRGDIVHNAYAAGAIGVLIFTDKKDYGGVKWFPDDKWMPPSGVQVGSVYDGTGDPTTPGWPSTGECERLTNEEVDDSGNVPLIPSLPISSADGDAIIRTIGGKEANVDWQGGKESPIYRVGPGPAIANLSYEGQQVISTIQNVIGVIEGEEEPDRFVILGNHRDAWTFGAVDPNSGTAALLEIAQRLEKLQKKGWRPRRTIVLCNWDAEEYGLIGSTEWVEENRELLASRVIAYLNVDCAVQAGHFRASATPQLDELIIQVAQQVQDPDNSSQTIYQSWLGSGNDTTVQVRMLGRLGGAGSDYAAFVQHIGIPALDLSFGNGYPVYHSMYDDFVWMKKFGDPMFHRHVAVASVWGLLALRLADDEVLPFNYLTYAYELQKSAEQLEAEISVNGIKLVPLYASIEKLRKAAIKIEDDIKALKAKRSWESVRELNDRLIMTERAFTDKDGLSSRTWYKHLIYAPARQDDYGSNSFPGVSDAIEKAKSLKSTDSWRSVQHEVWRVARAITQASLVLSGRLT
nr:PREDICTED: probable glutamate carboxypeptidase 2 isoform X1 [Nicotiana tabacum]